jgi:hypothetical protein
MWVVDGVPRTWLEIKGCVFVSTIAAVMIAAGVGLARRRS